MLLLKVKDPMFNQQSKLKSGQPELATLFRANLINSKKKVTLFHWLSRQLKQSPKLLTYLYPVLEKRLLEEFRHPE
jgi:hypothetical protein